MIIITYIKLLFLSLIQDSLIFKPTQDNIEQVGKLEDFGFKNISEVYINSGTDKLHLWVSDINENEKPIFIVFHGNTGHFTDVGKPKENEVYDRRYRLKLLSEIINKDANFIAVSMRGYGKSTGKPSEKNFDEDIENISNFIKEKNYKNIYIIGESLGAANALKLNETLFKKQIKVTQIALIAPFTSIFDAVEDKYPEFKKFTLSKFLNHRFINKKIISETKSDAEFLLFHPIKDETTNFSHSQVLLDLGKKNNLKINLFAMENCGHITWDAKYIINEILYSKLD